MIYQRGNFGFGSMRNTSNTKLLIHSDTTNGSTTFTDSSASGHTITATNQAQHSTAQKKFGSSSILFDGVGDDIRLTNHADFHFGSNPFTIDLWARIDDTSSDQYFFGITENSSNYMRFIWDTSEGQLRLRIYESSVLLDLDVTYSLPQTTWVHIAVIRGWGGNANDWAICVNGKLAGSATDSDAFPEYSVLGSFLIGNGYGGASFDGYIDEFRVVKGEAMWTTEFIPPAGPYS
jgi:hypothetical protein